MTIAEHQRAGVMALYPYSDAPDIDAQWLLLNVLGIHDPVYLITHTDEELLSTAHEQFQQLVEERMTGKPLAYLLGWAEFYGRRFVVNEHVLIPRPATEDLVEQALPLVEMVSQKLGRSLTVADIGTGSGCIAITLALQSPDVEKIYATDTSSEAIAIARKNAEEHGVEKKLEFLLGNMLAPLAGKPIDFIVSNPPYVPSRELENPFSKETRGLTFEPRQALDGGIDGLAYVRQIEANGIPTVVETVGGKIATYNMS